MLRETWTPTMVSAALVLSVWIGGCQYDPPPEVTLQQPTGGAYISGDSLVILFTEPIDPTTLAIRIWPSNRDIEGNIPSQVVPNLQTCYVDSTCGGAVFTLAPDRLSAELVLDPEDLGQPDVPQILEVIPGLADDSGKLTGASYWFDFQFIPFVDGTPGDPIEFMQGVYAIVGTLDEPVPTVLTFLTTILATPDNKIALAGAEGDEIGDAPRNTENPAELMVDDTNAGYTLYTTGYLSLDDNGERFLVSDPFTLSMWMGPIHVYIDHVKITSKIVTKDGYDHLEGTFLFEGVTLTVGETPHDYGGGSTALVGTYAPEELVIEGVPDPCGDLCGAVILGECNPPLDFPPEGFCEQLED